MATKTTTTPNTTTNTTPRRFIKLRDVQTIVALSGSEIYRRIAAGTFPKPISLGPKSSVWIEQEVQDWMAARIAECRGEAA